MHSPRVTRSICTAALLAAATLLAASPVAAQHDDGDIYLRLYDVRDIAAVLPTSDRFAGGDRPEAEYVMTRLCDANGLNYESVLGGILAIEGTEEDHGRLSEQLLQVRELFTERFEISVVLYDVGVDDAPVIGAVVEPANVLRWTRQVVMRRQPTMIESVTTHTYLADVVPIVGDGAVGYDPETKELDEGLTLVAVVGAGEGPGDLIPLRVSGELTRVSLSRSMADLWPTGMAPVTIDLPSVSRRSVASSLLVEPERLTVVGVIDGFDAAESLVLAVAVNRIE